MLYIDADRSAGKFLHVIIIFQATLESTLVRESANSFRSASSRNTQDYGIRQGEPPVLLAILIDLFIQNE
jgi:hypothetical protein